MGELINNNSRNIALRKGFAYSMKKIKCNGEINQQYWGLNQEIVNIFRWMTTTSRRNVTRMMAYISGGNYMPRVWGEQQQHNNVSNLLFTAHNSIFHPYLSRTKRWDTINVFKINKTLLLLLLSLWSLLLLLLLLLLSSSLLLWFFCRMIQTFLQQAHHHPSDAPEVHGGVPGLRRSGRWRNHGSWARAVESGCCKVGSHR